MSNTITIPNEELACSTIGLTEKGRKGARYLTWEDISQWVDVDGADMHKATTLSETEIHEYTAQALKELEHAQNAVRAAMDRADSLRMFARQLYASPSLKVASE